MRSLYPLSREPHLELEELRERLDELSSREEKEVVLDFSAVGLLDSLLLGQLVRLRLSLQKRGLHLVLINLNFQARMVVHHANLDALFGLAVQEPPRWDSNISTL